VFTQENRIPIYGSQLNWGARSLEMYHLLGPQQSLKFFLRHVHFV
jgi:hypothetical protein